MNCAPWSIYNIVLYGNSAPEFMQGQENGFYLHGYQCFEFLKSFSFYTPILGRVSLLLAIFGPASDVILSMLLQFWDKDVFQLAFGEMLPPL